MSSISRLQSLGIRSYRYWRVAGTRALAKRVQEFLRARSVRRGLVPTEGREYSATSLLAKRWSHSAPISVFRSEAEGRRLTVITDSVGRGSLFGGTGTALMLGAVAAQKAGARLRVVTRDERANPGVLGPLLDLNGIAFTQRTEFQFLARDGVDQLSFHNQDRFLTTSWWSTAAAMRLPQAARFYLIQEDERLFYPAGDEQARCEAIMADRSTRLIVNTRMLYRHLQDELSNLEGRANWFEPAFPKSHFHWQDKPGKRTLFFYARPNNPRNLFYLGVDVIRRALEEGVLEPDAWRLVLCGKDIPRISFSPAIETEYAEGLDWQGYAAVVRQTDLGLSLMATPHPSYPPLDLAASGAIVVTTSHGPKRDLSEYSENIIVAAPNTDALLAAVRAAMSAIDDTAVRRRRYEQAGLQRDWTRALNDSADRIAASFD